MAGKCERAAEFIVVSSVSEEYERKIAMNLGVNAVGLYPGKSGGAEQYVRNIIRKLEEYSDITTYLFLNDQAIDTFEDETRTRKILIDVHRDMEVQLKGYMELYNIDVWFCPLFHLIPVDCKIPNATAIFDIQQDYYPENFDKQVLRNRISLTRDTLKHTDMVLTISEFSKKTLTEKYDYPAEKIKVTYLDADSSFDGELDADKLIEVKKTLPGEFILFPANMWPHKNHVGLIKGFALAKKKWDLPLKLVFTGARERETPQIERAIEESGLREDVVYLGYQPQEKMKYIFASANMLAFPSMFEGFGIPLVEAMAVNLPIICANTTCLPEIAQDAAVLFDPESEKEIADAIYRVYTDKDLRKRLIQCGQKRRKSFSWEACARQTVEHLKSIYVPRPEVPSKLSAHPKVTVVTPSYNQGEFIRDTIESVLNQTYDNIEYIVMDGGSTDETVDILRSYGDRFIWYSEKDGGQADAVNKGIRIAHGEIIGWLNSDDTYYPDTIEKAVQALLEHPDVDMIYGEGCYIDRAGNETSLYATRLFDHESLANECVICQPAAFFTKEIVERVGLLRADLQLCMDYELWMRISQQGKIMYVPHVLATSRMYEDNKTLSRRNEVYREVCRELKRHYGYVPHSWVYGYAVYLKQMEPRRKLKLCYAALFIKYNYSSPKYALTCVKKYIRRQLRRMEQQKTPPVSNMWYADKWIGQKYETELRSKQGNTLVVKGENRWNYARPLELTVRINDAEMRKIKLTEVGPFEERIELPAGESWNIQIEANQTFVPSKCSKSKDSRALSVQIQALTIE